jgi:hypothetical protein
MMAKTKRKPRGMLIVSLTILSLVLSSIACQIDLGGPSTSAEPPTPTPISANSLEQEWDRTFSGDNPTGRIEIVLDEAQLTSFVSQQLAAMEDQVLTEPQVLLRDGQITLTGTIEPGMVTARVRVIIEPQIQPDGTIEFIVESIDLGPIPAPEAVTSSLSAFITESLTGTIGSYATGVRVTSIIIADGEVTIIGELR